MLRKLTVLVCLVSFFPAVAGAQDLAQLANAQPAVVQSAEREGVREVDLSLPAERVTANLMAANDVQGSPRAEEQRPRKTHTGLTFREFVDVHFGEYRWIYWVGAAAALVAIHVVAAGD
jgi:hypothetical protein